MTRTSEPREISKGERLEWTKTIAGFPATEWTLVYRFRSSVGPGVDVTAAADGNSHVAVIDAAESAKLSVGRYRWQAWVIEIADSTNTFKLGDGVIDVRQGFAAGNVAILDDRSSAKKIVDAIEAAMINTASREQLEYEIETPAGRRRVKFMSRKEQLDALKYWKGIVARELAAERVRNGGSFGRPVQVRFRDA